MKHSWGGRVGDVFKPIYTPIKGCYQVVRLTRVVCPNQPSFCVAWNDEGRLYTFLIASTRRCQERSDRLSISSPRSESSSNVSGTI